MLTTFDAAQRSYDIESLYEIVQFGWHEPGDGYVVIDVTLGQRAALQWFHESMDRQWCKA